MNSDGLQGGFYDVVWLVAFVLGLVTGIRRFGCLKMSLTMRVGRIQGFFFGRVGPLTRDKGLMTAVCQIRLFRQ